MISQTGKVKRLARRATEGSGDFETFLMKAINQNEADSITGDWKQSKKDVVLSPPFVFIHDRALPKSVLVSNIHQ